MWSFGAEYSYDHKFFIRGGYFYEHPNKGNRQYFSLGTGFKLTSFQIDAAYLISTVPNNPLDKTLRFSLSFDMDGLKNIMR
jgi:long-subunit fatty acid transport protein